MIWQLFQIYAVMAVCGSTAFLCFGVSKHGVPQNWPSAFAITYLAPFVGPPAALLMLAGYWCFRAFWKLAGGDA